MGDVIVEEQGKLIFLCIDVSSGNLFFESPLSGGRQTSWRLCRRSDITARIIKWSANSIFRKRPGDLLRHMSFEVPGRSYRNVSAEAPADCAIFHGYCAELPDAGAEAEVQAALAKQALV